MQSFYIHKNATLPSLRLELVNDGNYDFLKSQQFNNGVQNADVTFSMWDEHGVLKISEAPCNLILSNNGGCEEKYIIEYNWKDRDTKKTGHFKGKIKINFKGDIYENGITYDKGIFIGPLHEDLDIFIKD